MVTYTFVTTICQAIIMYHFLNRYGRRTIHLRWFISLQQNNLIILWKVILDMSVFEIHQIVLYHRLVIATYSGNYHYTIRDIVSPCHRLILYIIPSPSFSSFPTTVRLSNTIQYSNWHLESLPSILAKNLHVFIHSYCSTYSQILNVSYDKAGQTVCPSSNPNINVSCKVFWLTLNSFDHLSLSLSLHPLPLLLTS